MNADRVPAVLPAVQHYRMAGVVVASTIPLPLDSVSDPDLDVDVEVIERDIGDRGREPIAGRRLVAEGDEREIRLCWAGLAGMTVEAGRRISVARAEGITAEEVAPLVLGVGMGLILHQRGRLVLHASAVALPTGAVAFVGAKGAGKSTMAGALAARGGAVVADDALPVEVDGNAAMAWPGPAALKLWPESVAAIGRSPRRLKRLHPAASKRVVPHLHATTEPLPLRAIYALDVGPSLGFEPIIGHAALVELIRHSYAARFLPEAGATPAHFERCAQLAREVPMFRLSRPAALDRLDSDAAMVEEHAARLA